MRFPIAFVLGAGTGYFLDPQLGKRRRHILRDRSLRIGRRAARIGSGKTKWTAGRMRGLLAVGARAVSRSDRAASDETVKQRILSSAFRQVPVPAGAVDVDVDDGIATLRGSVESPLLVDDLVERVRAVPGVRGVTPLLTVEAQAAGDTRGD